MTPAKWTALLEDWPTVKADIIYTIGDCQVKDCVHCLPRRRFMSRMDALRRELSKPRPRRKR